MTFALGNLRFGGRVLMTVDKRPTVELPCGQVIVAEAPLEYIRASGECICDECGKEYWRHPHSEHKSYDGYPWMRKLCNGKLVKL